MQRLSAGTAIKVVFSLAGQGADPAAALRWRVSDEADLVVVPWTPVNYDVDAYDGVVTLQLSDEQTGLPAGELVGLRCFELEAGSLRLSTSVVLEAESILAFGLNTFLSDNQAMLAAAQFADSTLSGWFSAERRERERALGTAYQRVMLLPLVVQWGDAQNRLTVDTYVSPQHLRPRDMTPAQLAALDTRMLKALKLAQLFEADEILKGDPHRANAASNLTSLTVGESMQSMRQVKALDQGICPAAMVHVARWVDTSVRLGRG